MWGMSLFPLTKDAECEGGTLSNILCNQVFLPMIQTAFYYLCAGLCDSQSSSASQSQLNSGLFVSHAATNLSDCGQRTISFLARQVCVTNQLTVEVKMIKPLSTVPTTTFVILLRESFLISSSCSSSSVMCCIEESSQVNHVVLTFYTQLSTGNAPCIPTSITCRATHSLF